MAGITGILLKSYDKVSVIKYTMAFEKMLRQLAYNHGQRMDWHNDSSVLFGNVLPIALNENDNFQQDRNGEVFCVIDGMVFVSNEEKDKLKKQFPALNCTSDHQYLPYLYLQYNDEVVHHITGWYNIFIYDKLSGKSLLFNDRLGYLPLYVYEDKEAFLFASKIEAILSSGVMEIIEFDTVTIAEHLAFNYPISDNTYIQGINTLQDATLIDFKSGGSIKKRYWDVSNWFGLDALNKKQSIEAIDQGLKLSIGRLFTGNDDAINFSLTGGWDSRVVLSYLLPKYKDRLSAYSFGAPQSDDIKVPQLISQSEGFSYRPFMLDQRYLDEDFIQDAANTIMLSNGTRNYKRTHYVHAIRQMGQGSPWLLTGIFGDEVFKVGKPQGGVVISKNAVDFIDTGFDVGLIMQRIAQSGVTKPIIAEEKKLLETLEARLMKISARFRQYKTSGERYFAFRFTLNLRKYFGNEVNSYNDFVWCHSPFIDTEFLQAFASTRYMPSRFDYIKPKLQWQAQSSWLYYEITRRNCPGLTSYPSSRGFSMRDVNTLPGLFKVFTKKVFRRNAWERIDGFNTRVTDSLFNEISDAENMPSDNPINLQHLDLNDPCDQKSLFYWMSQIQKKYFPA
jgi:asparagine synthetase B (glutamine-hydrolysing)